MTFIEHLMEQRQLWRKDPLYGFAARPMKMQWGNQKLNYLIWKCIVPGEDNTPWKQARYHLTLTFVSELTVPWVRFREVLYHPNIDRWGYLTLKRKNVVGDPYDIRDILTSIQRMLSHPDLSDETHAEARNSYISNPDLYFFQARQQALTISEAAADEPKPRTE